MILRKANTPQIAAAVALILASAATQRLYAAEAEEESTDLAIQEVIVTGTRQKGIDVANSAAPIQVIAPEELKATGKTNLVDALGQLVPSFVAATFGSDMANQTLQASMRGLSPNHVLVLVDGKRRHVTANMNIGDGSASVDMNFIPMDAVDHVEVLTEGAAAQYGSDAIAGVINVILKKDKNGGDASVEYGQNFSTGGPTTKFDGHYAFQPTEDSFFNVTLQVANHGHTFYGNPDPRTDPSRTTTYPESNLPQIGDFPYLDRINGDAESHMKLFAFNAGDHVNEYLDLYAFGTYGHKEAQSFEVFRAPNKVYYCQNASGAVDPSCAAGETKIYPFPYGFSPQEQSREDDYQVTVGARGEVVTWNYDLSFGYGEDHMGIYNLTTANASIYLDTGSSPTDFYIGKFITTQSSATLDFSRDFSVGGLAGPLSVAFGGEFRRETYAVGAGDPASYFGGGAQGFTGYSPLTVVDASRKNEAAYVDVALTPITNLKIDAAGRFESYTDFGSATVGKLTARYDVTPWFAVRATGSSGFRAPTLSQESYTNINVSPTSAVGTIAANSAGVGLLGMGSGLKPERSTSLSFGVVLRPLPNLMATIDAYQILITDRIVATSTLYAQQYNAGGTPIPAAGGALVMQALEATGLSIDPDTLASGTVGVSAFVNGVDTVTRGLDFQLQSPWDFGWLGHFDFNAGATYNYNVVTRVAAPPSQLGGQIPIGPSVITGLTGSPRVVANLGTRWSKSVFYANLVERIYAHSTTCSSVTDGDTLPPVAPTCGLGQTPTGTYYPRYQPTLFITNLELGLHLNDGLTVAIGAVNLFNRFPNLVPGYITALQWAANDTAAVGKYGSSPIGADGGSYYVRASYKF